MRKHRCRRVVFVSLAVIAALFLGACSNRGPQIKSEPAESAGEDSGDIRIGMTFDTFVLERWTRDRDVFVDTARKLGASVDVQTANGDVEKQKRQIEKFIEENMDAIVIVATDCYSLRDQVTAARNKGIKVISYDRLIQGVQTDLYITVDNKSVGTLMAQNIKEKLPDGGNIVMIGGPETDSNSEDVISGFETELGEERWDVIYKSHVKSWAPENGVEAVADAFEGTEGEIDAIMCGNDGLAGNVIRSLSEQQLAGSVVVVAQDADLEACQRIVEGTQSMTVYKPINELAKKAAECTVDLIRGKQTADEMANGESVEVNEEGLSVPYIGLKPVAVTEENIDSVIIDSGFHSKEEVYLNVDGDRE